MFKLILEYYSLPRRVLQAMIPIIPLGIVCVILPLPWIPYLSVPFLLLFIKYLVDEREKNLFFIGVSIVAGFTIFTGCMSFVRVFSSTIYSAIFYSYLSMPSLLFIILDPVKILIGIQVFKLQLLFIKIAIALNILQLIILIGGVGLSIKSGEYTWQTFEGISMLCFSIGSLIVLFHAVKISPTLTSKAA